jgi:hypothetical protein
MALAGAAHRFREDMDLDGLLGAVLLHHASRADEHALLDVGHFGRDDHDKQWIVGQCQPQLRAVAILDHIDRALDALDRAADPDGFLRRCGQSDAVEMKLAAASTRRAMPDMDILPGSGLLVDGSLLSRTPSMQPQGVKIFPIRP